MTSSPEVRRLKRLYELSMTLSGDPMDIFVHVARMIGELLDVKVVCLSEIRGRELHFLSVYVQGNISVNVGHCPLDITPCATVEQSKDIRLYDRVMERFPRAGFLRDHNAHSYCGFPSIDNDGRVVAVTCLLDDRPREFTPQDLELLRIAGQRIGLEIARKHLSEQRQSAVEALQRSEARLRDVLDVSGNFIWEVDAEGRLTYLNRRFMELVGIANGQFIGRPLAELHVDGDIAWMQDYFSAVRDKRQFHGVERRIGISGDKVAWISISGTPLLNDQGEVTGFRGTVSDITERKNTELALRRSEERLELAIQGADLGLWDWDVKSGAVYFSDRWIGMLGYLREDIEPRYEQWVRLVHPDDWPGVFRILDDHLAGKSPYYEIEHRLLTKDGAWKWVWSSGKVLERDVEGLPQRAAGTHLDISARKSLEERLRQQQTQLAHAQRFTTAGELAATIVHELSQPLGAISSHVGAASLKFADLLAVHPPLQYSLDEISRLTQRASSVVRGIRELVQRRDAATEPVNLRALIEEILAFVRGEIDRRQIRLVVDIADSLPPIEGNRIQLQQLFLNLILNALDAMERVEHQSRILMLRTSLRPDGAVTTFVRDTGTGIAPDIRARLFEPFVTSKENGIGLGLPLCRTIAETHGGKIVAHSADRQGACFEVVLPTAKGVRSDA